MHPNEVYLPFCVSQGIHLLFIASGVKEVKIAEARNLPLMIGFSQICNIGCYYSQVQEVKFKWGQVRIRQLARPDSELMRHYGDERAVWKKGGKIS